MSSSSNILEIRKIVKRYPGVVALNNVDFTIKKGETHVLVGENGAGKSTLVQILCGGTVAEEYESFLLNGNPVVIKTPKDSIDLGIAAIQQHFSLVEEMSIADNIFLGREHLTPRGTVDDKMMQREAKELLRVMDVYIDPRTKVSSLSTSNQQVVEICKAMSYQPNILIMDEPTSGLTIEETNNLFTIIRKLHDQGVTILYISHRLEEVFQIGDRVTVLRNGLNVLEAELKDISHAQLTKAIVGEALSNRFPKEDATIGQILLEVKALQNDSVRPSLKDISFNVRSGEIVAIYGILGCGKNQLADTLFGSTPATGGEIFIEGEPMRISSPSVAIHAGMGYLTEDRHRDGLVEISSLMMNLTLPSLADRFTKTGRIMQNEERGVAEEFRKRLQLHTPSIDIPVRKLSGGNQQKTIFGKWLLTGPRVLVLNEPTKGVDVGSKVQIFSLMVKEAQKGMAVLLLTNEVEEAFEMGDRIMVMLNGQIATIIDRKDILSGKVTKDEILRIATRRVD